LKINVYKGNQLKRNKVYDFEEKKKKKEKEREIYVYYFICNLRTKQNKTKKIRKIIKSFTKYIF